MVKFITSIYTNNKDSDWIYIIGSNAMEYVFKNVIKKSKCLNYFLITVYCQLPFHYMNSPGMFKFSRNNRKLLLDYIE